MLRNYLEMKEKKARNIGRLESHLRFTKLRKLENILKVLRAHKTFQQRWIQNVRYELFYVQQMANIMRGLKVNGRMQAIQKKVERRNCYNFLF